MWAESCSVRCKQLVCCKETIFCHGGNQGKSAVTPTLPSKRGMRTTKTKHVSECTNEKLMSSLNRACAGVETARRPCRYSKHRPNVSRAYIVRKCLVRAMSPKSRWGGSHLWKQRCANIHIHANPIHFTQRHPPTGVTQYDFVQERQVAEGWEKP